MAYNSVYSGPDIDDGIKKTKFLDNNGKAPSADKLAVNAGSNSQPVYFTNGIPTACTDLDSGVEIYTTTLLADNWTWNNDENLVDETYSNKWHWQKYSSITMNASGLTTLNGMNPTAENYYADSATSISMNIDNSYSAKATCYIYCDHPVEVQMAFNSDDNGSVYLNGANICTITSCALTAIQTLNFNVGENILQVCYTEGSGGDGWLCEPKPSTLVGTDFLYMSAKPVGGYIQTVTPTRIGKASGLNATTILFPPTTLNLNAGLIDSYRISNFSVSTANSDGSITIKTVYGMKPTHDLTVYWIGYTPK